MTGKAKYARINVRLWADIFFGLSASTGNQTTSQYEPATIPSSPPYTVTVANSSQFVAADATHPLGGDLGVNYGSVNGDMFNYVTSPANAGEYTVNPASGVYTFAAPDAGQAISISYNYNQPSSGYQVQVTNQPQGTTPYFAMTVYQKISPGAPGTAGQTLPWQAYLPACLSSSLGSPTAQDAWTMYAFDFQAFADTNTGIIMKFNAQKQ